MQKFEFTFLTIETAKILRQHYATQVGDFKRAQIYDDLTESCLSIYVIETRVEGGYQQLMSHYVRHRVSNQVIIDLCDEIVQKIPTQLPQNASTNLIFKWYMIFIVRDMHKHNFEAAKSKCKEAVEWLTQKNFVDRTALTAIYFQWSTCHLKTNDLKTSKQLMDEVLAFLCPGEFN